MPLNITNILTNLQSKTVQMALINAVIGIVTVVTSITGIAFNSADIQNAMATYLPIIIGLISTIISVMTASHHANAISPQPSTGAAQ